MGVHISLRINVFNVFGRYPDEGLLDHMIALFLVVSETSILFSSVVVPVYIPISSVYEGSFSFLHILSGFVISCLIDNSLSNKCKMASHCGFDLHLSYSKRSWVSFHVCVGHLYVFLGEVSVEVLCSFWNWIVCVFVVELYEFLIYFEYYPLIRDIVCKYLLSFGWFPFLFCWWFLLLCRNFSVWCSPIHLFLLLFPLPLG